MAGKGVFTLLNPKQGGHRDESEAAMTTQPFSAGCNILWAMLWLPYFNMRVTSNGISPLSYPPSFEKKLRKWYQLQTKLIPIRKNWARH